MSYKKKMTKAGKVIDVVLCHDAKHNSPKRPRNKKINKTTETQKKHNDRRSKLKLFYLVSANYKTDDLWITLTYKGRAPTPEEAKKISGKFRRDLRDLYKKHEKPLKYITITEGPRLHHHMLINNIGIKSEEIRKLWKENGGGFVRMVLFGGDYGDYQRISNYMDEVIKKQNQHGWSSSKNLIQPKPIKMVVPASTWREPIKPPKGYYLDQDSVWRGETALGYPYLSYRLIQLPGAEDDTS